MQKGKNREINPGYNWQGIKKVRDKHSVTLIELLIATTLIGLLSLAIWSIDSFVHHHLIDSDRRAVIQNEASRVLEYMVKYTSRAVGSSTQLPIDRSNIGADSALRVWIDFNNNAQRDAGDKQIAYRYRGAASNYEVWFYSNYTDSPGSYQVIAQKISSDFSNTCLTYSTSNNYFDIEVRSCWDPDGNPHACNTSDNPQVSMRASAKMPSVSTH